MNIIATKEQPCGIDDFCPATRAQRREKAKLLTIDGDKIGHTTVDKFLDLLTPTDLVVVNDAATIPSRFVGAVRTTDASEPVEIRLASHIGTSVDAVNRWLAVAIEPAHWSVPTERRKSARRMTTGDDIWFTDNLRAIVREVFDDNGHLFELEFVSETPLFQTLFEVGRPIQYSHLVEPIDDWDQQTIFSGPAVAVEPPSSGFHLSWRLMNSVVASGIELIAVTHATGLSTTGDDYLDTKLPFPELSVIGDDAAAAVRRAKREGRRVVAMGTGVTRALEAASDALGCDAQFARIGAFTNLLRLSHAHKLRVVDAMVTGMHELGSSHATLLEAFLTREQIEAGYRATRGRNYLGHEYGDLTFVTASR